MVDFNRVIIAGNLTRDPDLKYTSSGEAVCNFDLAVNSYFKTKSGEKKDTAVFVPVTVWRKQAETVAEYLKKGRSALVEGRLKQEQWTDKDGNKRTRLSVTASLVRFLGTPPKTTETNPRPEPTTPVDPQEENIPF